MSKKAKDNPFSFFAYDKKGSATGVGGDLFDEDIFADSPLPGPKGRSTTSSATAGTGGSTTGDNPFSFFNQSQGSKDKDVPPPPPNSSNKSVKDRDKLFSTSSSVSDDDDDDSWATPVIPSKPSTKKGLAPPLPDMFPLGLASPSSGRRDGNAGAGSGGNSGAALEKYKRKSEQSEAMILGYEEKLKQANKKLTEIKEKDRQEIEELESALRLITRKFEEMQKRAEKAEAENVKLRKLVNQQQNNSGQYGPDWQAMNEKSSYAMETMKRMAAQSEQSINGLLTMKNDFQLLLDMLSSMDKISVVHSGNSS